MGTRGRCRPGPERAGSEWRAVGCLGRPALGVPDDVANMTSFPEMRRSGTNRCIRLAATECAPWTNTRCTGGAQRPVGLTMRLGSDAERDGCRREVTFDVVLHKLGDCSEEPVCQRLGNWAHQWPSGGELLTCLHVLRSDADQDRQERVIVAERVNRHRPVDLRPTTVRQRPSKGETDRPDGAAACASPRSIDATWASPRADKLSRSGRRGSMRPQDPRDDLRRCLDGTVSMARDDRVHRSFPLLAGGPAQESGRMPGSVPGGPWPALGLRLARLRATAPQRSPHLGRGRRAFARSPSRPDA